MHLLAKLPERMDDLLVLPRPEWLSSPYTKVGLWLMGGLVAVMLVRLGLAGWQRFAKRAEPTTLFNRLAGELGVGRGDRWLLRRIARSEGLASPITLLLSGATLQHHARSYADRLPQNHAQRMLRQTSAIARRMVA